MTGTMRTSTPEKILKIIDDLEEGDSLPLTRLTVLKKWFEPRRARRRAFGLWIARKAAGRKGKTTGEAGALLNEARALMGSSATGESLFQTLDPQAAHSLRERAQSFSPAAARCCWWKKPWLSTPGRRAARRMRANWQWTGRKTKTFALGSA